jgi:glycosyltransferase involved in cell wall biosynthesis
MIKIISCFWNAEKYIENCIKTLKNQKSTDFQVYLIDDMSTDNSKEILLKYMGVPNVTIIYNQHNFGCYVSRNVGISNAKKSL